MAVALPFQYQTGSYTVTLSTASTASTWATSTNTASWTMTIPISVNGVSVIQPRPRGWNGKKAVRCSSCARYAKLLHSEWDHNKKSLQYVTMCKRCGKDAGFVGRRF